MPASFRIWLFPALAGLALVGCMPNLSDNYLGQDPAVVFVPKMLVDQALMQRDETHPTADWGLSVLWQGDHYMLTQRWRIRAVQDIPLLRAGQMLALGTCRYGARPISRVVAILRYDPAKKWLDDVVGAWAYDFDRGAFVEYPAAHLSCLNPRYGLGLDAPPPASTAAAPVAVTQHPPDILT